MVHRENENLARKMNGLIQDSLKIKDIAVVKAERKASRSDMIPEIIIATLKTRQDKQAVMRHKRNLRNS